MLHLMRKHAGSWMIKVILFIIVVVFSLWGVSSMQNNQVTQVAEVNGETITREAYANAYNRLRDSYRQAYGDQLNEGVMKMLRPGEQALNQLIERILMVQEADRLDLAVSDQELADTIQKIPAFQDQGVFTKERYLQVLAQNNTSHEEFAQSYKQELLISKLSKLILDGVLASDEEAKAWYQFNNTEVSLDYVLLESASYKDIELTDEEVAAYFKENENRYLTDPQIKVRYLHFAPEAYKSIVSVSDEEVANYYHGNLQTYTTKKTIEARHILLKVEPEADAKTVEDRKKEAMDIFEQAKAGQDFAKLATQYSEGPTKKDGGYLGAFSRDAMVKPFADKAFAMEAGQVSEPVRTDFGWHLIKVEKINAETKKSLDDVAAQIRNQLLATRAREEAYKEAESAYGSFFDGDELTSMGQKLQVPAQTTTFFSAKEGAALKGIDEPAKFASIAFGMQKMDISEIESLGDSYYLMQVFDRREAQIPELASVSKKVRADLTKIRQGERAKADAEALLEKIKKGASMVEASADYNVKPESTEFFKRDGSIPKIGNEPQIAQSAFKLTDKTPLADQVIKGRQGWYVTQLKGRKLPSSDGFDKEKAATVKRLTDQKKRAALNSWIADLKARSTITIDQEQVMTP